MEIGILNSLFAVKNGRRQLEMNFQFDILIQILTDLYFFISIKNEAVTSDSPCRKEKWNIFLLLPSRLPTSLPLWMQSQTDVYIFHLLRIKLYELCNNHLISTPSLIGFSFYHLFFAITSPVFLHLESLLNQWGYIYFYKILSNFYILRGAEIHNPHVLPTKSPARCPGIFLEVVFFSG